MLIARFFLLCFLSLGPVLTLAREYPLPTCKVDDANDCHFSKIERETLVYPGGKARCMYNPNWFYGTNPDYLFRVIKGRNQDKNKLLIWFQGGGGCFSASSCSRNFRKMVLNTVGENIYEPNAKHNGHGGIFNRYHDENPFRDWTSIELPLCTADAFVGTSIQGVAHHHGSFNAEVVLEYIFKNMPNPDRIVIAGCSAGSMGAQAWAGRVIQRYREMGSKAQISVIGDSYIGNLPREKAGQVYKYWGACDSKLLWNDELRAQCHDGKFYFPDLMKYTIQKFPDVAFSFITSKQDPVERVIYCAMKYDFKIGQLGCIDSNTLYTGVEKILIDYIQASKNNVAVYVLEGKHHCVVQDHNMILNHIMFYTASIAEKVGNNSLPLKHWVGMLSGDLHKKSVPSGCEEGGPECHPILRNARIDFTKYPTAKQQFIALSQEKTLLEFQQQPSSGASSLSVYAMGYTILALLIMSMY